jgi:N-methylhydantoinase A
LTPEPTRTGRLRVGVDTGGTFTDLVAVEEETGKRHVVKVSSTPGQPADAVFEALRRLPAEPSELDFFVLGTTIATNCLLQRAGQRTLYLTTAGFEDIPFIQRIDRKGLHDLQWVKPVPYVLRRDCIGVRERVTYDGSIRTPLTDAEVDRVVQLVAERDREAVEGVAVAINFLFSYVAPEHERRLASALRAALPHVSVSASNEVAPLWREYERANTVVVDAYLKRLIGGFADEIDAGLGGLGVDCPALMLKSNGGQVPTSAAARQPSNLILSGLAGGLVAGKYFADGTGRSDVFTLDMGGTSCDVGVVLGGAIQSRQQYEFEWGLPIAVPVVDLTTIGAGGSSIASFDLGGLLTVGPESAGASPGPAAYGQGGTAATVTDANLVLGRLNPQYFLGGEIPLDEEAAGRAVAPIAERLGLSLEDAALAVLDMTVENMAGAIRLVASDRGVDFRRFDLIAFGGAGPLHAGAILRRAGLAGVVVPTSPGLASAFGTLAADLRVDRQITRMLRSDLASDADLRGALERLARDTVAELEAEGGLRAPTLVVSVSCRYLGQNFEQEVVVPLDAPGDLVQLTVERFHEAHERTYGYRIDTVVELVHLGATALERREPPPAAAATGDGREPALVQRPVYFRETGWHDTTIVRRAELRAGYELDGPAIVEEPDSTTLVLPGQIARIDASGSIVMVEVDASRARALGGSAAEAGR